MTHDFRFDKKAMWFDDLRPAFGQDTFFFEDEFGRLENDSGTSGQSSGQVYRLDGLDGSSVSGRDGHGRCVGARTGDMRYKNSTIAPRPL